MTVQGYTEPSYTAVAERLSVIWPDDPLIVDALVMAGFDVVGWWPLGDLPEVTQ